MSYHRSLQKSHLRVKKKQCKKHISNQQISCPTQTCILTYILNYSHLFDCLNIAYLALEKKCNDSLCFVHLFSIPNDRFNEHPKIITKIRFKTLSNFMPRCQDLCHDDDLAWYLIISDWIWQNRVGDWRFRKKNIKNSVKCLWMNFSFTCVIEQEILCLLRCTMGIVWQY